ncbi:hypothetical protein [Microbacterium sp. LMI1-1-1.1]|uniref:hypothetical protein n=1 Tax=Microbacterium sp. LMI1-1-1.1 TaxID=3135223 RepID=UPI0034657478
MDDDAPVNSSVPGRYVQVDRSSRRAESLTPEQRADSTILGIGLSVLVIFGVLLGAVPLWFLLWIGLFAPWLLLLWLVAPVALVVMAFFAANRAYRGGRSGAMVLAVTSVVFALALFSIPAVVNAQIAGLHP